RWEAEVRFQRSRRGMFSGLANAERTREKVWLLASGGGAGTGPSRGKPVTSYPIRLVTSVRALVGVSQFWSRESFSRASASVLPMIGITPGRTGICSGLRADLAVRPF